MRNAEINLYKKCLKKSYEESIRYLDRNCFLNYLWTVIEWLRSDHDKTFLILKTAFRTFEICPAWMQGMCTSCGKKTVNWPFDTFR
jgi:hypothetical protein